MTHLAVVCAWCGRLKLPDGTWALVAPPPAGPVSHGICPSCESAFNAEAAA